MIHSLFTAQHLTVQTGRLRPCEGGTSEQDYAWAQWEWNTGYPGAELCRASQTLCVCVYIRQRRVEPEATSGALCCCQTWHPRRCHSALAPLLLPGQDTQATTPSLN